MDAAAAGVASAPPLAALLSVGYVDAEGEVSGLGEGPGYYLPPRLPQGGYYPPPPPA